MAQENDQYLDKDVVSLLVVKLLVHKWLVLTFIIIAEVLSIVWLRAQTPLYNISVVLSPAETLSEAPSSNNTSALSGLLKPGHKTDSETAQLLYLLSSERLVQFIQRKTPLMQMIFPPVPGQIDAKNEPAQRNSNLFSQIIGEPASPPLSEVDAALWLQSRMRYQDIENTDLTEVTLLYADPAEGKKVLMMLYQNANEILRIESLGRSKNRVKYLKEMLPNVGVAEYRDALVSLLAQQEKKTMLLQEGSAFAAQILEGPRSSPRPVYPNYLSTLILGPLIGLLTALLIVTFLEWRRDP